MVYSEEEIFLIEIADSKDDVMLLIKMKILNPPMPNRKKLEMAIHAILVLAMTTETTMMTTTMMMMTTMMVNWNNGV